MSLDAWLSGCDRAGFEAARLGISVLWQSSILLAAVAAIAYAIRRRRAAVRHALWASALLMAPLLPLLGWVASSARAPRATLRVIPAYVRPTIPGQATPTLSPAAPAAVAPSAPPVGRRSPALAYPWALVLAAYAAGAAGFLALVAVGQVRLWRWARRGRPLTDARVAAIFRATRARLRLVRDAAIVESACVRTPMTLGALRRGVLLPAGFAAGTSDAELEVVALHELAHLKRHDPAVLAALSVVRAVLFFHPLVWLACRQVSLLAESACDDAVVDATGEPLPYARLLARLAEQLPRRSLATELAAGIVLSRGAFLRRIEAILSDRRHQMRRLSRIALAATVVGAAVSVALALALPLGERRSPAPTAAPPSSKQIILDAEEGRVRVLQNETTLTAERIVADEGTQSVRPAATPPGGSADGWGPVRSGLQTRLAAETDAHAVGRPVRLRAEMRNVGQAARTYIDRPFDAQDPLRVQGPDGRPVPYIAGPCQVMVEPKSIAPGETVVLFEGYDAAEAYLMASAGQYTATLRGDEVTFAPGEKTVPVPASAPLAFDLKAGALPPARAALASLMAVAPQGWFFGTVPADAVTPPGRAAVPGMQVYYGQGKGPGATPVGVWVTEKAAAASGQPLGPYELPTEALGKTAVGHVYVSAPAGTETAWPGYRQKILAALGAKAGGADAGDAAGRAPKQIQIETRLLLVAREARKAVDALVPDDLFDSRDQPHIGTVAAAKATAIWEAAAKVDGVVLLASPRVIVRNDQRGEVAVVIEPRDGEPSVLDDKVLSVEMRLPEGVLLEMAARAVPESDAMLVRAHLVFRRRPDKRDARLLDHAEAWADRVLGPDGTLMVRAPLARIRAVDVGRTVETEQGDTVYLLLQARRAP